MIEKLPIESVMHQEAQNIISDQEMKLKEARTLQIKAKVLQLDSKHRE